MDSLFPREEAFDTEINSGLISNTSDSQTNILQSITGGVTATAVDIGASIWNSLPGTDEVQTEELLGRISGDALKIYQENPDLIKTASLIGGAILPGGLAVKGMNAMRNGSKAVNWFTTLGKKRDVAAAAELFANGAKDSTKYKQLIWGMRGKTVANQTADAVAAEAAILGTMNAHSYMEDYMEDPVSNFALSVALGGGIGSTFGLISDAYQLRKATAAVETSTFQQILGAVKPVGPAMPEATKVQTLGLNVKNLDNIIKARKEIGKTEFDDLTYGYALKTQREMQKEQLEIFEAMLDPALKELDQPSKLALMDTMNAGPGFWGVEKIKHIEAPEVMAMGKINNLLMKEPVLKAVNKAGEMQSVKSVYFPETGQFGTSTDVQHYAGMAALQLDDKKLDRLLPANSLVPNVEYSLSSLAKSTAATQAEFGAWVKRFEKLDDAKLVEYLSKSKIAPGDVPQVQAIISRLSTSQDLANSATVKLAGKDALAADGVTRPTSITATLQDLKDTLAEQKHAIVTSLISKGYPPTVISKRANIPEASVNQFIASDRSVDTFKKLPEISAFKSSADVDAANRVTNRPIELAGNLKKVAYTQGAANLNARTLTNIDGAIKSAAMMNSGSLAVRELGKFIFEDMKQAFDIARMNLSKITNEAAGNRFLTSADQAARNMGELGPIFSMAGKHFQKVANDLETTTLKPITEFMAGVSKDLASKTEYSVAHNLNAGLKGWRTYKDKQFWQKAEKLGEDGKPVMVLEPVTYNGKPFTVATEAADKLLTQMQVASKDLYELSSVSRRITGSANLSDIGLWIPSFNPVDKFIAYVHDRAADTTKMLWGKTAAELDDAIRTFSPELQKNENLIIVKKDNQAWWSKLNGRLDSVQMERADLGLAKTGTGASAIPQISTDVLAETAGGYQHYINAQVRNLADLALSDITDTLDNFSVINKAATEGQTLSFVRSITQAPKDAAASMKNLLLGNPSLGEYEGWRSINKSFEVGMSMGANAVGTAFKLAASPRFKNPFSSKKALDPEAMKSFNYEVFEKELKKAGVVNPFEVYDRAVAIEKYGVSTLLDTPDTSKRIITASNALAATIALRFGELAHPIVNLMSMPILTTLANAKNMPESFMGVQRGTAKVPTSQIMFEGIRQMNSPRFKSINEKWEKLGYFKPLVSEASEVLRASRSFEKGAIAKIENALDSKVVEWASWTADNSEQFSRKIMMNTGAALAKRLYPELGDNGVTIFARDFMDKALGNYTASQRPAFFQGTMGVAMGLFQTYMLTLAQGVYRAAELRDFGTLGKAAMAQSTIFGTSSLPGFDYVSKAIAENFSDENVDLTTGTYRALGDTGASFALYGMPSNLTGAAFYTRGDVDPRFPNVLAGADNVVAVNMAIQMAQAVGSVGKAVASGDQDTGQAILQALSLQSMSRPLARMSELASDYSMTKAGNTVQNAEEVWSNTGMIARVMALRPMEEAKLREAQHLNQYYGTVDRDNRQAVVNKLRTAIRNGTVDSERIAGWAEEYFRNNGTPTGWRSAYKSAIAKTDMSGKEALMDKLRDDDPLNYMINNLD